jgi:hypothetical protein
MKNNYPKIYLAVLLIIPLVLLLLPSTFFDSGDSICMSVIFFDRECYACGMTRAIQHLIHFDFSISYSYHKLSFIVLPILIISFIKEIKRILVILKI